MVLANNIARALWKVLVILNEHSIPARSREA